MSFQEMIYGGGGGETVTFGLAGVLGLLEKKNNLEQSLGVFITIDNDSLMSKNEKLRQRLETLISSIEEKDL